MKLLVMFIVMSMNFYICVAVILGMTVGKTGSEIMKQNKFNRKWSKMETDLYEFLISCC